MKVLILDGFQNPDEVIVSISKGISEVLKKQDWGVELISLKEYNIAPCQGCFECWVKTPGTCRTDDYSRIITKKMVHSDLIIHFTPITFGGYSYQLKKVIDRSIPILLPFFRKLNGEIHHKHRYEKRPSIIVIGLLNKPNEQQEVTFRKLIKRNSLNMGAPLHESIIHSIDNDKSELFNQFNKIINKLEVN